MYMTNGKEKNWEGKESRTKTRTRAEKEERDFFRRLPVGSINNRRLVGNEPDEREKETEGPVTSDI